eukprot:GILJ01008278.1.p1 GENE.GILJ01008278.1~~GILJ01008278.1.p1  ORF type:complete len:869 (-),score=166.02 GILJ01008278.1:155-2761(-)
MPLPPKEQALFKQIIKYYEQKQYKKGLKCADSILKKFPDDGETLAMRGLTLNCMDKKEEAYDYVRRGLRQAVRSHVCWHVYGLLYRSDRDYMEAIKCYRNALRIDQDNVQILRDLSLLQIQMRDLEGYKETTRQLLTLKPTNKNFWLGLVIAHHLMGLCAQATKILSSYESTQEQIGSPYEQSELVLYKAMLLEESGDLQGLLDHLNSNESAVVDRLGMLELRAKTLLQMERREDAEAAYRALLKVNPDNYNYYYGIQAARGLAAPSKGETLDLNKQVELADLYDALSKEFPKSIACKRIPLDLLSGDLFMTRLHQYVQQLLRKGVPSLFSDLKSLYSDPVKASAMTTLVESYIASLKSSQCFPSNGSQAESPSTLLWTLFLGAQHYNRLNEWEKALQLVEEAIQHTPTVVDLYLCKGRIYKHAGDLVKAAQHFDEARRLDLADRYLNTKCTLHQLRAGLIEQADETILLFTREGESHSNLHDMQCMWYENEIGLAYYRSGKYGKALKKLLAVDKHFNDIVEDQFDFHTYCLRKMTLRAYVRLLRMEDHVQSHKFWVRAAVSAIQVYLALHDKPHDEAADENESNVSTMTAEEKKKAKLARNKARKKAEQEAKAKAEAQAQQQAQEKQDKSEKDDKEKEKKKKAAKKEAPVDNDPEGVALAQVEDPLAEAVKLLKGLLRHASSKLETHISAFEIYIRKKKYLLALQALTRLRKLFPEHPETHRRTVQFFHQVDGVNLHPAVAEVIATERNGILNGSSLVDFNSQFVAKFGQSLPHRRAAAESLWLVAPAQKRQVLDLLNNLDGASAHLEECTGAYEFLVQKMQDNESAQSFANSCRSIFPLASTFNPQAATKTVESASIVHEEHDFNV